MAPSNSQKNTFTDHTYKRKKTTTVQQSASDSNGQQLHHHHQVEDKQETNDFLVNIQQEEQTQHHEQLRERTLVPLRLANTDLGAKLPKLPPPTQLGWAYHAPAPFGGRSHIHGHGYGRNRMTATPRSRSEPPLPLPSSPRLQQQQFENKKPSLRTQGSPVLNMLVCGQSYGNPGRTRMSASAESPTAQITVSPCQVSPVENNAQNRLRVPSNSLAVPDQKGAAQQGALSPSLSRRFGSIDASTLLLRAFAECRSNLLAPKRFLICVVGPPGCGRGRLSSALASEFDLTLISCGAVLRRDSMRSPAFDRDVRAFVDTGRLVPFSLFIATLASELSTLARTAAATSAPGSSSTPTGSNGLLIDGFPRDPRQLSALQSAICDTQATRILISLSISGEALEDRLVATTSALNSRASAESTLDAMSCSLMLARAAPYTEVTANLDFKELEPATSIVSVDIANCSEDLVLACVRGKIVFMFPDIPRSPFEIQLGNLPLIFVLGGPGSGKGTQCSMIRELYNLRHLSVGDLLREEVNSQSDLGGTISAYISDGKIVPMEITLCLLKSAILKDLVNIDRTDDVAGFLVDGFPREIKQCIEFERKLCVPSHVLFYECSIGTLEQRLLKRGETSGRADDNLMAIKKRFVTFRDQSMPVVAYYEKLNMITRIHAEFSVKQVLEATISALDGLETTKNGAKQKLLKKWVFPNVVYVLGGPGCGKGTQCARLAAELGYTHVSTGDLLRRQVELNTPIGREAARVMAQGGMISTAIMRAVLLEAMRRANNATPSAKGFLVDGYPRTLDQAEDIVLVAPPKLAVYFECPDDVLIQRLLRRGETSGRADDNPETISARITAFAVKTAPVINFFDSIGMLHRIDATGGVEDIHTATLSLIEPAAAAQLSQQHATGQMHKLENEVAADVLKPSTEDRQAASVAEPAKEV